MSKAVHKATVGPWRSTVLTIRPEAPIVLFAEQRGELCVWYEQHDTGLTERQFIAIGTGMEVPADAVWRGSALAAGGDFVFHLYEVQP